MSERSYSVNYEYWDDIGTLEGVMEYLNEDGSLNVGDKFFTGFPFTPSPSDFIPTATSVVSDYNYNIENCGKYSPEHTDGNTGSDMLSDEAKEKLTKILRDWADENMNITFYTVKNDEEIEITQEMIDAFHAKQPIPMPEFKYGAPDND